MAVNIGDRITDGTVVWEVKKAIPDTTNNNIPNASASTAGLMTAAQHQSIVDMYRNYVYYRAVLPYQSTVLRYTGSTQTPTWTGFDSSKMEISTEGGTRSATAVGTYDIIINSKGSYTWPDTNASGGRVFNWSIQKALTTITVNKSTVTLNYKTTSTTVTITRNGDGAIQIDNVDSSVASTSLSGTTLTITRGSKEGTTTIYIRTNASTNYEASTEDAVIRVTNDFYIPLEECTIAQAKTIIDSGKAAQYWNVGDVLPVTLNGTANGTTFSNKQSYAFILGFDHNSLLEGSNKVHFGLFKTKVGSIYKASCLANAFGMTAWNNSANNAGGWASSNMRTTIMNQILAILPSDLQNIISSQTKYTDNMGAYQSSLPNDYDSMVPSQKRNAIDTLQRNAVTTTSDKLFLLSVYEVVGEDTVVDDINPYEKIYTKQYAYYANGNDKIRYNESDGTTAEAWWTRSVESALTSGNVFNIYQDLTQDAEVGKIAANTMSGIGIAPAFVIAKASS